MIESVFLLPVQSEYIVCIFDKNTRRVQVDAVGTLLHCIHLCAHIKPKGHLSTVYPEADVSRIVGSHTKSSVIAKRIVLQLYRFIISGKAVRSSDGRSELHCIQQTNAFVNKHKPVYARRVPNALRVLDCH